MKFQNRNANFWKWGLELGLLCFILIVTWSIYHLSPSLFPLALLIGVAELVVTLVYTVFTTVTDPKTRYTAWVCMSLIATSLAINTIIHAALSRRYDVASQHEKATEAKEKIKLQQKQIEVDLKLKENESQRLLAEQNRKIVEAQNKQLSLVDRNSRRVLFPGTAINPTRQVADNSLNPISDTDYTPTPANKPVMLSPAEVQENAFLWIMIGIIVSISSVVGTSIGFIKSFISEDSSKQDPIESESGKNQFRMRNPQYSPNLVTKPEQAHQEIKERDDQETPLKIKSAPPPAESHRDKENASKFTSTTTEEAENIVLGWQMPKIENCRWKGNRSQKSIELWTKINPKYVGRFGPQTQQTWKSMDEEARISSIRTEAENWKKAKGVG